MIRGWWFGGDVLPNGDGRPVRVGETLTVDGPLVLCGHGLHLSERALDALQYATCTTVWRVEVPEGAEVLRGDDKLCVSARTHVQRIDAAPVLCAFTRQCALDVAHLWDCPPAVRQYLETGDESLRDAARAAARAAAGDAAWAALAAASAASVAAWAASAAARDASVAAKAASAASAARAAALAAQAQRLDEMLIAAGCER